MSDERKDSIRDAYIKFKKDPDNQRENLCKVLNDYKDAWFNERKMNYDKTWRTNHAFYTGNHYTRLNRTSNAYRVSVRENYTNQTIQRILSIITANLPVARVFANSSDEHDIKDAEITEQYGKYYYRTQKLEQKLLKHVKASLIWGSSFVHTYWDPSVGGKVNLNSQEKKTFETDSYNENIPEEKSETTVSYHGDVRVKIDSPFKWLFRPGFEELDDMYDAIRVDTANKQELEKIHGKQIESEPVKCYNPTTQNVRYDDDLVLQNHYWHKPTPWFPEGLYATWVGGTLLKVRESIESEEKLPVTHLPFDQNMTGFYGMSGIESVMDLQEQLNRASSMIIEARNLVARPRWWVADEAKVPDQQFTDRPGGIVKFNKEGGPPQIVVPAFGFAEMNAHKADVRNSLQGILGSSPAARGDLPQATRTALALQLVLEQDRSQYAPFIKMLNQNIIDIFYAIFANCAEFIDESDARKVKIEGSNYSSKTFHGGLVPSPADIYLEDLNPMGWTKMGMADEVGHLVELGILQDRNQILEMLQIKSPDPAYRWVNINKQTQERELELLKEGKVVEIGPEDDDEIHLKVLSEYMASFDFKSAPRAVREACMAHAEEHKQRKMQFSQGVPAPDGAVKPRQVNQDSGLQLLKQDVPGQNLERLLSK